MSTKFTVLDEESAKWRLVNETVADLESKPAPCGPRLRGWRSGECP